MAKQQQWSVIGSGRAIKASPTGELKGCLVVFSDQYTPDLTGDFFTGETDLDMPEEGTKDTPIYYDHGLDPLFKRVKIGRGTLTKKDDGVWLDGQLDMTNPKVQALLDAELGLSSGTASYWVERERIDRGEDRPSVWWIKSWPLGIDASLTAHPAEPRTIATVTIKSLLDGEEEDGDEAGEVPPTPEVQDEVVPDGRPEAETAPETAQAVAKVADEQAVDNHDEQESPAPQVDDEQKSNPDEEDETVNAEQLQAALKSAIDAANAPLLAKIDAMEAKMAAAPAVPNPTIVPGEFKAKVDDQVAIKAFVDYVRGKEVTATMKTALVEGTGANGGYLVPTALYNQIVTARRLTSVWREAGARVLQAKGTNTFNVDVQIDSTAATQVAEGGSYTQLEPTFSQVSFKPYKFTALSKFSDELEADSAFSIEELLVSNAANAFTLAENENFAKGTGSGAPQGAVTGSAAGATAAGAATVVLADVTNLYYSLSALYRRNAVWMMNDATRKILANLNDSTGRPLLAENVRTGQPGELWGRPIFICDDMANAGTGNKSILFGDLDYFWIADWTRMEAKRLNEVYAGTGQIGIRWYSRFDSHVVLSTAIKHLVHP